VRTFTSQYIILLTIMSHIHARKLPRDFVSHCHKHLLFTALLAGSLGVFGMGTANAAPSTTIPCMGAIDAPNMAPGTGTFIATDLNLVAAGLTGTCDIVSDMPNYVTVDVDFVPNIMDESGTFTYSISVSNPGWWFTMARVDSDVNVQGSTPTTWRKEVFSDAGLVNKIWDFTSTDGSATTQPLPGTYAQLWVRDTYNVPSDATFDVGTNTFYQTPGPLPVLGAGAAFGLSRKVRQRIKASRAA
jgi:hypothetical protein